MASQWTVNSKNQIAKSPEFRTEDWVETLNPPDDQGLAKSLNPRHRWNQSGNIILLDDFDLPNGNEKRQPEAAIETATRSGKKQDWVLRTEDWGDADPEPVTPNEVRYLSAGGEQGGVRSEEWGDKTDPWPRTKWGIYQRAVSSGKQGTRRIIGTEQWA